MNATLKTQLDIERHRGKTIEGALLLSLALTVYCVVEALQTLRAVRVEVLDGQRTRIGHVTAIGAAMLAMQADNDLAC